MASMRPEECEKISAALQLEPYYLDCSDAVPMRRPRLCWTTEYLENLMDDVHIEKAARWKIVHAEAEYPKLENWIEPGCKWPGGVDGHLLPTAMKAIKRSSPPWRPAGVERCDDPTLGRWQADDYRTLLISTQVSLYFGLNMATGEPSLPKKKSCYWAMVGNIHHCVTVPVTLKSHTKHTMTNDIVFWVIVSVCSHL